jgi:hypothetical protein
MSCAYSFRLLPLFGLSRQEKKRAMSLSAPVATLDPPALERAQAIQADYYNIIDKEGWPVAALLVLSDRRHDPVRAELHLYEDLEDDVRQWAFRQGRALLEARYYSAEPVPLKIFQSYPGRETVQVRTSGVKRTPQSAESWFQRWQLAAAVGIALLLLALVWAVTTALRGPTGDIPAAQTTTTQGDPSAEGQPVGGGEEAPDATSSGGSLPPSQHADPNLAVGKRARVRQGLRLSLVTEPGPNQSVVGYMQDQQEATVVEGPVLTQGTSDTIVWWRLRLDDGAEAWAPANTSDGAVLELVE